MRQQMNKPENEVERLISVRSLRSTLNGATTEMAALASLARGVFGTAFAAVNIVEEDWLRIAGQAGLVLEDGKREDTVCTRVVFANRPVIIPDLTQDPELKQLPYVSGNPHFRFYAGAPLALEPGLAVGAFCLFDHDPRGFTEAQIKILEDFAIVATALLRLQKSNIVMSLAEQDLRLAAMTDPLTGFFNRSALTTLIDTALADALGAGQMFGALYLDVDAFKTINDQLGHHAGDEILRQGASRIRATIRSSDVAVRMGGDEFAVFVAGCDGQEALRAAADRLVAAFRQPFLLEGRMVDVSVSVGAALAPEAGNDRTTLLRNVDEALYRAKSAGRDRFALHPL